MKRTFALLVIVYIAFSAIASVETFEDGSWGLGTFPYAVSGCFPWGLCAK